MDDVQRLILEEVQGIRSELRQHIREESDEFKAIRKELTDQKVDFALVKQKVGIFSATVSAIIAGLVTFFSAWAGK